MSSLFPSHPPEATLTKSKNKLLTEAGRAPWYRGDGKPLEAFVIGVAGGSASGKTSVAQTIIKALNVPWVVIVAQDSFYKSLTPEQSKQAFANNHDFDSPDSFDYPALRECINDLKACKSVEIPVYSFTQHQRMDETQYLYGAAVIIVEGIFVLHDPKTRALLDMKVFVQCDSDIMLARRIRRDTVERGRDLQGILDQYLRFVKPSYDDWIKPTSKWADVIIPSADNSVAIELITTHIQRQLNERRLRLRPELATRFLEEEANASTNPSQRWENLIVMKQTSQLHGIHTILRDQTTSMEDFIFYSERLATMIVQQGLNLLKYADKTITTAAGHEYAGKRLTDSILCGVTILRSGACLEKGLRRTVQDCTLGSLLIQSDDSTGEPLLFHCSLPAEIKSRKTVKNTFVFLLDSQIGSGAAAFCAIRVLLDHGVDEGNIVFLCFLVSERGGVKALERAFPRIRIVTSAVDPGLEECYITASRSPQLNAQDGSEVIPLTRIIQDEIEASENFTPLHSTTASKSGNKLSALSMSEAPRSRAGSAVSSPEEARDQEKLKRIWRITPGIGSFGERYFGTGH